MFKIIKTWTVASALSLTLSSTVYAGITLQDISKLVNSEAIDNTQISALYNRAVLEDEGLDNVIKLLDQASQNDKFSAEQKESALLVLANIQWRYGDQKSALSSVNKALRLGNSDDGKLLKARLLDSMGKPDDAWRYYELVLEDNQDEEEKAFILTRLTMIDFESNVQSLTDLAMQRDQAFRNRAATVLALKGKYKEALVLYKVEVNEAKPFQAHARIAEWALKAEDFALAQHHAWQAFEHSVSGFNGRYGIALLLEAYRKDGKLELAVSLFEQHNTHPDVLNAHLDTLVELGRYNDAIELLQQQEANLTIEQNSRLLSLYQAANRLGDIESEFRKYLALEPERARWYVELARHYLNIGEPEQAAQVWQDLEQYNQNNLAVLVAGASAMVKMGGAKSALDMVNRHKDKSGFFAAYFFLFETYLKQGDNLKAADTLAALDAKLPATSAERKDVADAYERLSQPKKALAIYQDLDKKVGLGYDETMRLAWLYSVAGERDQALTLWQKVWIEVNSPARRSFAEAQMMQLAAELNKLADIVVELEDKLLDNIAHQNDINLLVRIYVEANDQASAIDVVEEYAEKSKMPQVAKLNQMAKVYQMLGDAQGYGEVLAELIEAEPEFKVDHLRNLLLNVLTNERSDDKTLFAARIEDLLQQLETASNEDVRGEFEATIMVEAGFLDKAINSYRKAIAQHPKQSDNLLLLVDLMQQNGQAHEAVASMQYVAEHAAGDNEFITAIDGIINLIGASGGQENRSRVKDIFRWVERVILERIAGRADKFYLYQLLSEIAQETSDPEGQFRAIESSLPQADIRRAFTLRELITLATPERGFSSFRKGDVARKLTYGRRLVALNQPLPPEIYINLAKDLLDSGDVLGADKAFGMINDITGTLDLDKERGDAFLKAGHTALALNYFSNALNNNQQDLALLKQTGQLREQVGQYQIANNWYWQALSSLLKKQAGKQRNQAAVPAGPSLFGGPVDTSVTRDFKPNYENLAQGFILTWPTETAAAKLRVSEISNMVLDEANKVKKLAKGEQLAPIEQYSRLDKMADFARRVAEATGNINMAKQIDTVLLNMFAEDQSFIDKITLVYSSWYAPELHQILASHTSKSQATSTSNLAVTSVGEKLTGLLAANKFDDAITFALVELDAGNTKKQFDQYLNSKQENAFAFIDFILDQPAKYQPIRTRLGANPIADQALLNYAKERLDPYNIDRFVDLVDHLNVEQKLTLMSSYLNIGVESFDMRKPIQDMFAQPLTTRQLSQFKTLFFKLIDGQNIADQGISSFMGYMLNAKGHPSSYGLVTELVAKIKKKLDFDFDVDFVIDNARKGQLIPALQELSKSQEQRLGFATYQYAGQLPPATAIIADTRLNQAEVDFILDIKIEASERAGLTIEPTGQILNAYLTRFPGDQNKQAELIVSYWQQGNRSKFASEMSAYIKTYTDDTVAKATLYRFYLNNQQYQKAKRLDSRSGRVLSAGKDKDLVIAELNDWKSAVSPKINDTNIWRDLYSQLTDLSSSRRSMMPPDVNAQYRVKLMEKLVAGLASDKVDLVQSARSVWRSYITDNSQGVLVESFVNKVNSGSGEELLLNNFTASKSNLHFSDYLQAKEQMSQETRLVEAMLNRPELLAEFDNYLSALQQVERHKNSRLYQDLVSAYIKQNTAKAKLAELIAAYDQGLNEHQLTLLLALADQLNSVLPESVLRATNRAYNAGRLNLTSYQLLGLAKANSRAGNSNQALNNFMQLTTKLLQPDTYADSWGLPTPIVFTHIDGLTSLMALLEQAAEHLTKAQLTDLYQAQLKQIKTQAVKLDVMPVYATYAIVGARVVMGEQGALEYLQQKMPTVLKATDGQKFNVYVAIEQSQLFAQNQEYAKAWSVLRPLLHKSEKAPQSSDEQAQLAADKYQLQSALIGKLGFQQSEQTDFGASNSQSSVVLGIFMQSWRDSFILDTAEKSEQWLEYVANELPQQMSQNFDNEKLTELTLTLVYRLHELEQHQVAVALVDALGKHKIQSQLAPASWTKYLNLVNRLALDISDEVNRYLVDQQVLNSSAQAALVSRLQQRKDTASAITLANDWFKNTDSLDVLEAMKTLAEQAENTSLAKRLARKIKTEQRAKKSLGV